MQLDNPSSCEMKLPPFQWDPTEETRAQALQRAELLFRRDLVGYLDRVEEAAKNEGMKRTRTPKDRHFDWLVHFQIHRKTYTAIARSAGLKDPGESGRKAVTTAVRNVADLVGLRLVPRSSGGRPRADSASGITRKS
jgi:hypothetical protein